MLVVVNTTNDWPTDEHEQGYLSKLRAVGPEETNRRRETMKQNETYVFFSYW